MITTVRKAVANIAISVALMAVTPLVTSGAISKSYENRKHSEAERLEAIGAAKPGELPLTPTFASYSVKYGVEEKVRG